MGKRTDPEKLHRLRRGNAIVGLIHLAQAALILILSKPFSLPLQTGYLGLNPVTGTSETNLRIIGQVRLGPLIAIFLFLAAIDHLLVAAPGIVNWYERNLSRHVNHARWMEYSLSASLMIVIIAMLSGVYDLSTLILLFFLNAAMIWFGWIMERRNQDTEKVDWTPFVFGCIVGIVPWVIIALYFVSAATDPANRVPAFVYGIMISIFVLFNIFALNMFLQYKKVGPWRDYLFGEWVYILLSLIAKSVLAWQVFGGTLR